MTNSKTRRGAGATGERWRDNYRTPEDLLERARRAFAAIADDKKPFSGELYDPFPAGYSQDLCFDGFNDPWQAYAWVNPPFSRYREAVLHGLQQQLSPQLWICRVDNSTKWFQALWDAASGVCLLNQRVRFIDPRTNEQAGGTDIGCGNAIFYVGPQTVFRAHKVLLEFRDIGRCIEKLPGYRNALGALYPLR